MKIFNSYIDFNSFFKKGIKSINDDFGIYMITGYQGTGKTYFAVYLVNKYYNDDRIIYTNIKSLNIPNRKIIYFERLSEIVFNIEEDRIFIIDELSKLYSKDSKPDKPFYSWLQQSRKRRRSVFLITQEYIQVPQWLRGLPRYVYTTNKIIFIPIFITKCGLPILDPDTLEWTIDPLYSYIYKRNKIIANYYDTMEPIQIL